MISAWKSDMNLFHLSSFGFSLSFRGRHSALSFSLWLGLLYPYLLHPWLPFLFLLHPWISSWSSSPIGTDTERGETSTGDLLLYSWNRVPHSGGHIASWLVNWRHLWSADDFEYRSKRIHFRHVEDDNVLLIMSRRRRVSVEDKLRLDVRAPRAMQEYSLS